ncbi:N-terminal nucleophile aminohydrolase [Xylona heveae TC161]|uniref:N-terminal nucleophile aminohydrolase n=1 Tax=Xylona heveae (strain CBS 132557 / TC161) TaxID=1328760 RepID=A0A165ABJ6_XYLHT|nr:N-terminal nucleophile aminohydrolase [Xylona heveae TC161]KZF20215.1 N-terminal nucleophile aminohydrolase [Xylona heveae TC161]
MCRWFAYVSDTEPCILEDVLIHPQHSLTKQVNEHYFPGLLSHEPGASTTKQEIKIRNALYNMDGMGMAWYTNARQAFDECKGLRPAVYKTISTPLNDFNFRSLAANTSTKACFAHIRAASGGVVSPVNNHPFIFGRHAFMHNGTVENFTLIRRELCTFIEADCFANIKGSTDSEHLAALYMTFLTDGQGKAAWERQYPLAKMKDALQKAIMLVLALQQKQFGPAVAESLVACRFRNHKSEQPPSLYYSTTAGVTLNRKYPGDPDGQHENECATCRPRDHGPHVIVASEPSTYKREEWTLVPKNNVLTADRDGNVTVEPIVFAKEWDGKAESDE